MAATPAIAALEAAGVRFETAEYEPPADGSFGEGAVAALGLDPAATAKTLVVALDDGTFLLALVPVDARLDLKAVARAVGAKKARLADADDAERLTGSVVGGIAPLGHRRAISVLIDPGLADSDVVHVSGGRRGLEVTLGAADLVATTGARVVALTARPA